MVLIQSTVCSGINNTHHHDGFYWSNFFYTKKTNLQQLFQKLLYYNHYDLDNVFVFKLDKSVC